MSTPKHCPGFERFKDLESFLCRCPTCGAEKEIFSDEFDRAHLCPRCKEPIDFSLCEPYGGGRTETPR